MKTTNLVFPILAASLVAFAGCKKADQSKELAQAYHGVIVDWSKLDSEFANAASDVQASISSVKRFLRYGQFPQALMDLDKLSTNPNLTEPQKKLVNNLIEQTKKEIDKAPPPGQ